MAEQRKYASTSSDHPTDDELELYALRRLQDPSDVESHLLVCDHCMRRLDDAEAFITAFRAAHARDN